MCRFVAYHGPPLLISKLLHEPENSLIHQSHHSRERKEPLNGDGFGLGWYVPDISEEPALFHSVRPAWNDHNLYSLAHKTRSETICAHIRAATIGKVSESNCHPFQFQNLLMMHNGTIGNFDIIMRKVRQKLCDRSYHWIQGGTDSEHFFALVISYALKDSPSGNFTLYQVQHAFREALKTVTDLHMKALDIEPILLNSVITNGKWILATKFVSSTEATPNTLYYSANRRYDCDGGVCTMTDCAPSDQSVLIVSEKLTDISQDWKTLPLNSFLLAHENGDIQIENLLS
ncbi:MAG: class II glutamine amidotransferase [Bdellovibrionales bacterium]|nr:class II glutamine amidotransferase [Bdellovibrionales bacterium]